MKDEQIITKKTSVKQGSPYVASVCLNATRTMASEISILFCFVNLSESIYLFG